MADKFRLFLLRPHAEKDAGGSNTYCQPHAPYGKTEPGQWRRVGENTQQFQGKEKSNYQVIQLNGEKKEVEAAPRQLARRVGEALGKKGGPHPSELGRSEGKPSRAGRGRSRRERGPLRRGQGGRGGGAAPRQAGPGTLTQPPQRKKKRRNDWTWSSRPSSHMRPSLTWAHRSDRSCSLATAQPARTSPPPDSAPRVPALRRRQRRVAFLPPG